MIYLLIIYFIILVAFIAYSAAGIYHLSRFGYVGDLTKPAIFVYSFLSLTVILLSLILIAARDWTVGF